MLLTFDMPAVSHMIEDRAKDGAISLVVSLGDQGTAQVQAYGPEGQHQPHPVLLVLLHREPPEQRENKVDEMVDWLVRAV